MKTNRWVSRLGDQRAAAVGALTSIACGVTGLIGWLTDNPLLRSVVVGEVTMRPVVAMSLISVGVGVLAVRKRWTATAAAATMGTMVMMLTVVLAGATEAANASGIQAILRPAMPSVGTVIALCFSAAGLLVWLVGNGPLRPIRRAAAIASFGIGAFAIAGYAIGSPILYWDYPKISVGVAIHTAVALMAIGLAVHEVEMNREALS